MHTKHLSILTLVVVIMALIAGCGQTATQPTTAPPTPVENTVVVEQTVEVTKIVKEDVIVTATPEPTTPPEPVTINYFTFSAAPDHMEDLEQMIQVFEESHPNITVEVQTAPFDEYFTKLQTLIAGGTPPDVFELNYENFVSFASRGVLRDLGPLAEADEDYNADIFYPRAYEAFNQNGMQLGLPETFSTVILYYNQDLFDEAGVEYPQADWTWSDAAAAAEQLTDSEADVYGLYSPIQFWEFYKKAAQNNCRFFNEDKTEVTINEPECVEALETMVSFMDQGVMPTDAEMGGMSDGDMFAAGQLAMDVTGIWMFSAFEEAPFTWDIVVEPGMEQKATHFFANGVSAFAATEHPQEAWEWIKFFTSSPEVAQMRVESGWELPALKNPEYFESYLEQSPPENRQAVFDSLEYAITPPVIEQQNEMTDIVNNLLEQVKLGQLTPQEALDQADTQLQELIEE